MRRHDIFSMKFLFKRNFVSDDEISLKVLKTSGCYVASIDKGKINSIS